MSVLVIATGNAGKLREFRRLLDGLGIELRSLADYPGAPTVEEDGATFAANARKKALAYAQCTGAAVLADDSGLEVDALGGAPGVHSARYAGAAQDADANIDALLSALADVPVAERSARFRCVIAVALPSGATLLGEGTCAGRILTERQGEGGFGYDPVFFYEPDAKTFAELPAARKNEVSHRAAALAALIPELGTFLASGS